MRIASFVTFLLAFLFATGGPVFSLNAGTIEYRLSGVVTLLSDNQFRGLLHLNDPFTAGFVLADDSPNLTPDDPARGRYNALSAYLLLPTLELTFSHPGTMSIGSSGISFGTDSSVSPWMSASAVFSQQLPDHSLPTTIPPVARGFFDEESGPTLFDAFKGLITSAVVVPEPGAICLLLLGLIFMRRCR